MIYDHRTKNCQFFCSVTSDQKVLYKHEQDFKTVFRLECRPQCPDNYYKDTNECKPCHETCSKCRGLTISDCTSCYSKNRLVSGFCLPFCPQNYFFDVPQFSCRQIDPSLNDLEIEYIPVGEDGYSIFPTDT